MYYLRTRPAAEAIKFTLDVEALLRDGGDINLQGKLYKSNNLVSGYKSHTFHKKTFRNEKQ